MDYWFDIRFGVFEKDTGNIRDRYPISRGYCAGQDQNPSNPTHRRRSDPGASILEAKTEFRGARATVYFAIDRTGRETVQGSSMKNLWKKLRPLF